MSTFQDARGAGHASWNAGDLCGYLELCEESIRLRGCSPEPIGKAEVRGFCEAIFAASTPRSSSSTRCCGTSRARSASR
jgi:hypothetical protein